MPLTVRTRLTLWYCLVVLATLAATAVVLTAVHLRLGMRRIDNGLDGNLVTAAIGIDHEINEGLSMASGVSDSLSELELPGSGVAMLEESGRILGVRASGVATPPDAVLRDASGQAATVALDQGRIRMRGIVHAVRGQTVKLVVWSSLGPLEAERATVRRTLWLAMPAGLLFAAVGGWLIGWRVLAPLSSMARQANAMDDRQLGARLSVPRSGDELSALAVAFNSLLDRLEVAFDAQRRFMADASHQLRTPLSITRIAAQVTLAHDDRTAAEYRGALDTVAQQTQRMTRMVDDMFALALADLDGRRLQLEEVYLNEIVTDCVAAARVLAAGRGVSVRANAPADVQIQVDESLVRQMILNLVENAVRHTPAGGSVQIDVEADAARARIAISDTGTGIPEADRDRIFERFVRLAAAGADGGGGLGLPIARWVAQLHRGTLTLESTGPTGSRFVAVLPLR